MIAQILVDVLLGLANLGAGVGRGEGQQLGMLPGVVADLTAVGDDIVPDVLLALAQAGAHHEPGDGEVQLLAQLVDLLQILRLQKLWHLSAVVVALGL